MRSYEELKHISHESSEEIHILMYNEIEILNIIEITTQFNSLLGTYYFTDDNKYIKMFIDLYKKLYNKLFENTLKYYN